MEDGEDMKMAKGASCPARLQLQCRFFQILYAGRLTRRRGPLCAPLRGPQMPSADDGELPPNLEHLR